MKVVRLSCLVLVAALVAGLATASSAFALPEFTPTGASVTANGGGGTLKAGANTVGCEKNEVVGGPMVRRALIGPFRIRFVNCKSSGASKAGCAINSSGQSSGVILTNTLHIVPVLLVYESKRHTTNVLILPVSGKEFALLLGNECTKETTVTGQLVGDPSPVGRSTTESKFDFSEAEEKEAIVDEGTYEGCEGNGEYKGLTAYSVTATDAINETVTFSSATELT
jgi:hypothetical protein